LGFSYSSKLPDFELDNKNEITHWLSRVIDREHRKLGEITIVFVAKDEILDINSKFLNHDYHTDVISFSNAFLEKISGEIIICVPIVKENAVRLTVCFKDELYRVIVHGLLHLIGYIDYSDEDKILIREKENYYLNVL